MTTTERQTDLSVTPASSTEASRRPRSLTEALWSGWPALDRLWPALDTLWPLREGATLTAAAPIRIEEMRDGDDLVIRAEIPGVDPDKDIDVSIDDGVLTIKAERSFEMAEEQKQTYHSEFQYGSFIRRLRLPKGCSDKDVSATYRDGVLEVRLPAPEGHDSVQKVPVNRG